MTYKLRILKKLIREVGPLHSFLGLLILLPGLYLLSSSMWDSFSSEESWNSEFWHFNDMRFVFGFVFGAGMLVGGFFFGLMILDEMLKDYVNGKVTFHDEEDTALAEELIRVAEK